MSSHKFGIDGASLLGGEGGKNSPRITKIAIKTLSTKKPIILLWKKKKSSFLESNKLLEEKTFRYQYCSAVGKTKSEDSLQV